MMSQIQRIKLELQQPNETNFDFCTITTKRARAKYI